MCGMKAILQFAPAVKVSANSQFSEMNENWKWFFYFLFFLVAFSLLCYRDDVGATFAIHFRILIYILILFFNLYDVLIEIITSV